MNYISSIANCFTTVTTVLLNLEVSNPQASFFLTVKIGSLESDILKKNRYSSKTPDCQVMLTNKQRKEVEMEYVLIIHEVEDYTTWKKIFDDAASIRKKAGEQSYQVLKYEKNPTKIVHFSKWSSLDNAKSFFESPELVEIRKKAGVKAPEFIYLEQLADGVL